MLTQNEAMGAATASGGGRAPVASFWVRIMTPCTNVKDTGHNRYCQIPVFSLGVSQHNHKITNLLKYKLNQSSKLRDNERKTPLSHEVVCFRMLDFETSKF